jgi:predicted SprT family Zn-dependent metalloprotease
MNDVNPTAEIYLWLQGVAQHFNEALFDNDLPSVVFTLNRGKSSAGYFSPSRWRHRTGNLASEIAVNPTYFANQSLLSLLQTICHEQCHQWQHVHGKPGRVGYHNAEWAKKMMSIGLMPSSTGASDGAKTGQKMADYPIPKGRFVEACAAHVRKGIELPWVDRGIKNQTTYRALNAVDLGLEVGAADKLIVTVGSLFPKLDVYMQNNDEIKKMKIKYVCTSCGAKVWGKSGLRIACNACNQNFQSINEQINRC